MLEYIRIARIPVYLFVLILSVPFALAALFESGDVRLTTGTPEDFVRFFSYFEPPSDEPIPITLK